jgi:alpha-tubulin suppressor-like RCC1 family protein
MSTTTRVPASAVRAILATAVLGLATMGPAPAAARQGVGDAPGTAPAAAAAPALSGVRAVATGSFQSCALRRNQQVWCWGDNARGELGDGTRTSRAAAAPVQNATGTGPLTGVTAITAGLIHTCALLANHEVRCWGDNSSGQLGLGGTETSRVLPTAVANESGESPLRDVAQISAGETSTCARLASGQVRCWGANDLHQLGNGVTAPSSLPVPVSSVVGGAPLVGVTQIDAGASHVCARLSNGRAVCWGGNFDGMLGDGSRDERVRPVAVANGTGTAELTGVRRVTAGGRFSCAELVNATARCWGDGRYGEIGDGQTLAQLFPTLVRTGLAGRPLRGIANLEAGYGHACARMPSRQVRCWGDNSYGTLGNGNPSITDLAVPRPVRNVTGRSALTGVAQVRTSAGHACVRLTNGRARCWGYGEDGQLGDGARLTRHRPVPVRIAVT